MLRCLISRDKLFILSQFVNFLKAKFPSRTKNITQHNILSTTLKKAALMHTLWRDISKARISLCMGVDII